MLNVFTDTPETLLSEVVSAVKSGAYPTWKAHTDGTLRYIARSGAIGGKLVLRRYDLGITFRYLALQDRGLSANLALRAKLHGRMLEILARHYLGKYSYVVFEPLPLAV